VDPFDRFTRHPLEEVLVGEGALTRARADELLASAHATGEPFGLVLIESGTMTPWDLAKTIATHYQMPVHPLVGYRFDKELLEGMDAGLLHRHQVIPLGAFGRTRTFAVLQPPDRTLIDELTAAYGASLFFFVAEGTEIGRILRDEVKVIDTDKDSTWSKLFDEAEEGISKDATARKA
jgi:hypothetical protein